MFRSIRTNFRAISAQDKVPVRRSARILCALATSFPLYLVFFRGSITTGSIYGALVGYFLTLNDHQGTLPHRLWISSLTFLMLCLGFLGGISLQSHATEFFVILGTLTYWIGLMGGEGAEFEKAVLFSTVQVVVSAESAHLSYAAVPEVFTYAITSFGFVILVMIAHDLLSKRMKDPYSRISAALQLPWKSRLERHVHAFSYACTVILAALWMRYTQSERGYWAIVTVLIVMKPDRKLSMIRAMQRLIGTALAVLACEGFIYLNHETLPILLIITESSFFIPLALKRNYAAASFLITTVIVCLLDLPSVHLVDLETPLRRLETTAIGCLFGAAGVFLSKAFSLFIREREKKPLPESQEAVS